LFAQSATKHINKTGWRGKGRWGMSDKESTYLKRKLAMYIQRGVLRHHGKEGWDMIIAENIYKMLNKNYIVARISLND
jgi:hypothetical protein